MKYKVNLLNFSLTSKILSDLVRPDPVTDSKMEEGAKEISHHKVKVYAYRKARRLMRIGNRKHATRR